MKVLVTGATGFIGRRLCAQLAARGVAVRALHRKGPGDDVPGLEWREFQRLDDGTAWPAVLEAVDVVVHLAGLAHQLGAAGEGRWEEFFQTNVVATRVLARACAQSGVRRLVFVSSIAAVASCSDTPVTEATKPAPGSDYGRSKLAAEHALEAELRDGSVDWCILRPPVIYGPGNPGNMERLLSLIRRGLPLPIGAIRNRRSFMFIDNLVDGIARVCEHRDPIRATLMVGDDTQLSTPDLVRALASAGDLRARILWVPVWLLRLLARIADLAGHVLRRSLPFDSYSVSKLTESLAIDSGEFRRRLGWQPPISTAQGLRVTSEEILAKGYT
jgi:nucleoside-diphosphate-sugar epimerase